MKKKILIFHYGRSYGGGDVFLESLLPDLAKNYDLVLATVYPEKISSKLRDKNVMIPVYRVRLKDPLAIFGIFAFWNILNKEKIDLLFTQDIALSLFARIFQIFKRGLKHITVIHANFRHFNYKLPVTKPLISFFNRISQRLISKYICVSEYLVETLVKEGVPRSSIELIYNSVPVCDALAKVPGKKVRVGFVGRLSHEKGIDHFLEIARKFADEKQAYEFHVFGDGPWSDLVKEAQEQYPDLIIAHGFVRDVFKKNDLDLVIMPSRDEGMPYTALECMACGIPLIASRAGGLSDLIQDGENGLLCQVGDIEAFVGAIDRSVSDHQLRNRLIKHAHEDVRTKYNVESMREKYVRLFNNSLGG